MFDGSLDMGHARALLSLEGPRQLDIARQVAAGGLSVRETERLIQDLLHPVLKTKKPAVRTARDIERFEEELSERFGTSVTIKTGIKGTGKLVIVYSSAEHLDDLLSRFKG